MEACCLPCEPAWGPGLDPYTAAILNDWMNEWMVKTKRGRRKLLISWIVISRQSHRPGHLRTNHFFFLIHFFEIIIKYQFQTWVILKDRSEEGKKERTGWMNFVWKTAPVKEGSYGWMQIWNHQWTNKWITHSTHTLPWMRKSKKNEYCVENIERTTAEVQEGRNNREVEV